MPIRFQLFPRSAALPEHLSQLVAAFEHVEPEIGTPRNQLNSNEVLRVVGTAIGHLGYQVEQAGPPRHRIRLPVLYGLNGEPAKTFQVDAFEPATGTVVEVEAGRGVVNYQFLKDLFEGCAIQVAQWLVIAVMNAYHPPSQPRPIDDFRTVRTFLDTLYASNRLDLPLRGVLVLGY